MRRMNEVEEEMTTDATFRLISLEIKNIWGMSASLDFRTTKVPKPRLIVIHSYNRTGKTKIVDAINDVLFGFKILSKGKVTSDFIESFLGKNPDGFISLVFTFRGLLYRIIRSLYSSGIEKVAIHGLNKSLDEYFKVPSNLRGGLWSRGSVLMDTEVKGGNSDFPKRYDEILASIGLKKAILQRMIAKENVQEFRKAIYDAIDNDEMGYTGVSKIVSTELTDLKDAIEATSKAIGHIRSKVSQRSQTLETVHKEWLESLKEEPSMTLNSGDNAIVEHATSNLTFQGEPASNIQTFESEMDSLELLRKGQKDGYSNDSEWAEKRMEDYKVLDDVLSKKTLSRLSPVIDEVNSNLQEFEEFKQKIATFLVSPATQENDVQSPAWSFNSLLGVDRTIITSFNLEDLDFENTVAEITSDVKDLAEFTAMTAANNKQRVELIKKHSVEAAGDCQIKIDQLKDELEAIKNPPNLRELQAPIKLIGVQDGTHIRIYAPLKYINDHVISGKPLEFSNGLFPYKEAADEGITDDVIEDLSKTISDSIKELLELEKLFGMQEALKDKAVEMQKKSSTIEKSLDEIEGCVDSWDREVNQFARDANQFLVKKSDYKGETLSAGDVVSQVVAVESEWKKQLVQKLGSDFESGKTLLENASAFKDKRDHLVEDIELVLTCIQNVKTAVVGQKAGYQSSHREFNVARNLIQTVFPLVDVIGTKIKENINLESIDDTLLDRISKAATKLYRGITNENRLVIEHSKEGGRLKLRFRLRNLDGTFTPILDADPSGSEQASISLGAMYALAGLFHSFLVMDEVTDKFDPRTKKNFLRAINTVSEEVFTVIVLRVDREDNQIKEELSEMMEVFQDAVFVQTMKHSDDTMTAEVLESPESFKTKVR